MASDDGEGKPDGEGGNTDPIITEKQSADASTAPAAPSAAPPPAFKSRSSRGNIRRRRAASDDDGDDDDEAGGVNVSKKARAQQQGLSMGIASKKDGNGDGDVDNTAAAATTGARFVSDRKIQESGDALATAELQTETEFDRDARALRAAVLTRALEEQQQKRPGGGEGEGEEGDESKRKNIYTGARNYSDHNAAFRRNLDAATAAAGGGKAAGSHGPLRASVHARMSVRFDYQPDICKDYKETGYCGYGDACKFLHDRGDHKSGWQIDREWEEKQKREAEQKKKRDAGIFEGDDGGGDGGDGVVRGGGGDDGEKEGDDGDDKLPFACLSCKKRWAKKGESDSSSFAFDPVVTRCGHHFCEACALRNASRDPKCPVCGKAHGGTFNVARDVLRKLGR